LLVDHQQALVGGINVTTSGYGNKRREPQLDFAVALSGKTVRELVNYCQMIFIKSYPKPVVMEPIELRPYDVKIQTKNDLSLKISINDWVYGRQQITKAYTQRTRSAQREIIIINSYFFPRKKFMKELVRAAQRGVRVRLILAGISDWPSSILASQYLYDYFLKHGVEIYQWQKSVLHGKLATVDGNYTTIGSFSLNYTGYQQNLEMNVDIISGEFTSQVNSIIDEIIAVGCEKIEQNSFEQKTTLRLRFLRFVFYLILSIVASFSVTLTHQEKGHDSTP
jgi:cardiolipin synthase